MAYQYQIHHHKVLNPYLGYRICIYIMCTLHLSYKQRFILFSCFPFLLAFDVGGLGFEFCVFITGWRHALRSEWPFIVIIIIIIIIMVLLSITQTRQAKRETKTTVRGYYKAKTVVLPVHHHHHHQKAFRNKSHTSHGHRPGLKRNKSKGKRLTIN